MRINELLAADPDPLVGSKVEKGKRGKKEK